MKRQPRAQRRLGTRVTLMARDHELLRALARLRLARTSAIVQLCFQGVRRETAARRLRRLYDARVLDVRSPNPASEGLYSLGPAGWQVLREQGEKVVAAIPRGGLTHHLAIVETWVALATMLPLATTLQFARADWELRAECAGARLPIVPDIFAVLESPEGAVALAVEVDLGTEPLKVLRAKLAIYRQLYGSAAGLFGWPQFVLAVVTSGRGRLASMRELLAAEWLGPGYAWLLEDGPAGELSRLVGPGLRPLTVSPSSKGRESAATSCAASPGGERG